MEKHKILLILLISFFVLALSFLLLKLEKKTVQLAAYKTISANNQLSTDSLLQTYGASLNETGPANVQNKPNCSYSLFLETKIYSATARKPYFLYCNGDSSVSITIYDKYSYPNTENPEDNFSETKNLARILLKYH